MHLVDAERATQQSPRVEYQTKWLQSNELYTGTFKTGNGHVGLQDQRSQRHPVKSN